MRLTVAQALVRFLRAQQSSATTSAIASSPGVSASSDTATWPASGRPSSRVGTTSRTISARNEQAMVHTAVGYARMSNRLRAFACTSSVGPGATNMVTGAAVATTNRIPVLLLPGDVFATRRANPVLQELEDPSTLDLSVNDALRPVSKYFDRVWRPEQLPQAMLHAMRVLTDPAETGAVTLALPQDVQTEAWEYPESLFATRVWRIRRPPPEEQLIDRVAAKLRSGEAPAHRRRRWRHLQRGDDVARRTSPRDRRPGRRDASGQGVAPIRSRPERRFDRRDGNRGRERDRARRGPRHRCRHPLERFHHGLAFGLPEPRRRDRQRQRDAVGHREALRPWPSSPTPASPSTNSRRDSAAGE